MPLLLRYSLPSSTRGRKGRLSGRKNQSMRRCIKSRRLLPVLIAVHGFLLPSRVAAQTFTVLHSFAPEEGCDPHAALVLSGNVLYGTTVNCGRFFNGTIFAMTTNGTGFSILHNFTTSPSYPPKNSDGANPSAPLLLSGDFLFGTALYGGKFGSGSVFKVRTNGTGFTTLHSFAASDGARPSAELIISGDRAYTNSDGVQPLAGLVLSDNTLYGAADQGGPSGGGTVFKLKTDGTEFTTLHNFGADGIGLGPSGIYTNKAGTFPLNTLFLTGNTLFGTAIYGGNSGNGTVFRLNTDGTGFTTLHSFTEGSGPFSPNADGMQPNSVLALAGSRLYGTTSLGGTAGFGTIFSLNTDGTGFVNMHSFTDYSGNKSEGINPSGGLIVSGHTLYGTTRSGGYFGLGTVYSLSVPPPILSVSATPNLLWPPNHQMVHVTIAVQTDDNYGPTTSKIVAVTSNEPTGSLKEGSDWHLHNFDRLR
jgi:uncharacterized repeat protein (TIGR03803 family)